MQEGELVEFLYILFGIGIVALVYYPNLFNAMLPLIALIGAFYLVWGVLSRITSGLFGVAGGRRQEWWSGVAILTVIVLIFGQERLAVSAVGAVIGTIWALISGIMTLAL